LDSNGRELKPSGRSSLTNTAESCSNSGSPTRDDTPMSEPLLWPTPNHAEERAEKYRNETSLRHWEQGRQIHTSQAVKLQLDKLTSSRAASPASRLAMPASDRARQMIATSGRKCFELYELSGRHGSWQKTFMASLLTTTEHYSTRFTTTWKAKVTKRSRRLFFQLAPSARRTGGIASGLWPTPNVPNGGRSLAPGTSATGMRPDGKKRQVGLHNAVKMWPPQPGLNARRDAASSGAESTTCTPLSVSVQKSENGTATPIPAVMWATPRVDDAKNNGTQSQRERHGPALNAQIGGQLNPQWVEWLMGYPVGWTDLEVLETQLSRKSPVSSEG